MSAQHRQFGVVRFFSALVAAMTVVVGGAQSQVTTKATICQTGSGLTNFYDVDLRNLLDQYIPAANVHSTLIVLTQCYGGDCLDNFAGRTNTTVLSATSPGEVAYYGGYDDDAATALNPGPGRTSTTVHTAGVNGKNASETPLSQGPLVSLEIPTAGGPIKGRHVLYFAGIPDGGAPYSDDTYRETIRANLTGDFNTTFKTCGGSGAISGYDFGGTFVGMCGALQVIQGNIGPDDQFVLFISDHGDQHKSKSVPCAGGTCTSGQIPLGTTLWNQMLAEPFNVPRVSILSPGSANPGPVTVQICTGAVASCPAKPPQVEFSHLQDSNHDNDITDPGEGRVAIIEIPESTLDSSGVSVTVTGAPPTLTQVEIDLGTGVISKLDAQIPAVSTWGIMVMLLLLVTAGTALMMRGRVPVA